MQWISVAKKTAREFSDDRAPLYAAALAYFGLFAIAPLVVLVMLAASIFLGTGQGAQQQLSQTVGSFLGEERADAIQQIIANAQLPGGGVLATVLGVLLLLFAASRLFTYLELSLNRIWDVQRKRDRSLQAVVRKRATSFALVAAAAILILAALVLNSVLVAMMQVASDSLPFGSITLLVLRALVMILIFTPIVMALFKYVPDAEIEWGDVAVGGAVTAVLLAIGLLVIGQFVGQSNLANAYGSLASFVVVLLWLYYTALIFLVGAEFTQVYAREQGHPIKPEREIAERRGRKTPHSGA